MSRPAWNMSEPSARSTIDMRVMASMISIKPTPASSPIVSRSADAYLPCLGELDLLLIPVEPHGERGGRPGNARREDLQRSSAAGELIQGIVRSRSHVARSKDGGRVGAIADHVRLGRRGDDDDH